MRTEKSTMACLHERFEKHVVNSPESIALVVGTQRLTYRELNVRANRIAHLLRTQGVGPETLVGVLLERSVNLVAALLGVLKAGGAYLPLDPAYPVDRLAFMLDDAEARVVLTQASLGGLLQDLRSAKTPALTAISLDTDPRIERSPAENPRVRMTADRLAYVIYTSGSTGSPKGVALEHRQPGALIDWAERVYSARERDGVMAGTSICFDPSILDLFMPLCLGGKVILARDALELPSLPAAREVRLMFTVPSVARELLRIDGFPPSLETINMGGERLPADLVQRLYAKSHIKRVYDLYGPTETTTCSTFALRASDGPETIGRAIDGTEIHILDEHGRSALKGTTGEIHIGGTGVARGYLRRPELDAAKFVHIAGAGGRTRVYRTGDLGRVTADGSLEFAGRVDNQVKIRGFRIELGEIESVLRTHPSVDEAVVVASDGRLAAYVTPQGNAAGREYSLEESLRSHLRQRVPEHMLPAKFTVLDRLPLTPTGKIDHAALAVDEPATSAGPQSSPDRTPTEALIARIWSDLLGRSDIPLDDDFFMLGGDSLGSVAVVAQIRNETGLQVPLEAMTRATSVRQLAALVDRLQAPTVPAEESPLVEIQPSGSRPPLFFVHGVGGGMLWGYANLARHLGSDQPVYTFKACSIARTAELGSIEKLAAHYVAELRRFRPHGPYALGGYCFGGNIAYEMARLLVEQGQQVSLLALINSVPPNSSYYRVQWSLSYAGRYLRNLGRWIRRLGWEDPRGSWQFLGWKLSSFGRKATRWARAMIGQPVEASLDEQMDLSAVPKDQRELWELHVRLLDHHVHRRYSGDAVLFRTAIHPVDSSCEDESGWRDFVQGALTLKIVPGSHESVLTEPHVKVVANLLSAHLAAPAAPARQTSSRNFSPSTTHMASRGPAPAERLPGLLQKAAVVILAYLGI
jgi:amino acid adenylation domain-containing protein